MCTPVRVCNMTRKQLHVKYFITNTTKYKTCVTHSRFKYVCFLLIQRDGQRMEEESNPNGEFQNTRSARKTGEMRYRSYEYEVEGTDLGVRKNGGVFWGSPRSRRVCGAIHGSMARNGQHLKQRCLFFWWSVTKKWKRTTKEPAVA